MPRCSLDGHREQEAAGIELTFEPLTGAFQKSTVPFRQACDRIEKEPHIVRKRVRQANAHDIWRRKAQFHSAQFQGLLMRLYVCADLGPK
jgi:hypothetical protein